MVHPETDLNKMEDVLNQKKEVLQAAMEEIKKSLPDLQQRASSDAFTIKSDTVVLVTNNKGQPENEGELNDKWQPATLGAHAGSQASGDLDQDQSSNTSHGDHGSHASAESSVSTSKTSEGGNTASASASASATSSPDSDGSSTTTSVTTRTHVTSAAPLAQDFVSDKDRKKIKKEAPGAQCKHEQKYAAQYEGEVSRKENGDEDVVLYRPNNVIRVEPGEVIEKTFRYTNPSHGLLWASGTALCVYLGNCWQAEKIPMNHTISADDSIDVPVKLTAPQQPGRYIAFFKVIAVNGKCFGHRSYIDFIVNGPTNKLQSDDKRFLQKLLTIKDHVDKRLRKLDTKKKARIAKRKAREDSKKKLANGTTNSSSPHSKKSQSNGHDNPENHHDKSKIGDDTDSGTSHSESEVGDEAKDVSSQISDLRRNLSPGYKDQPNAPIDEKTKEKQQLIAKRLDVIEEALEISHKMEELKKREEELIAKENRLAQREKTVDSLLDAKDVKFGEKIGEGRFGTVYKGAWHGLDVAIKRLNCYSYDEKPSDDELESFFNEIATLKSLRHPKILLFLGTIQKGEEIFVVTEFVANGSLYDYIRRSQVGFPLQTKFAADIAMGMTYLHEVKDICHRDLRTTNILVTELQDIKIADFGLSGPVSHKSKLYLPILPPEVLSGEPYTKLADIFSFGLVLWEMFTKEKPWGHMKPKHIKESILNGNRPEIPENCPMKYRMLIEACWDQDPKRRPPSFEDIKLQIGIIREDLFEEQQNHGHYLKQEEIFLFNCSSDSSSNSELDSSSTEEISESDSQKNSQSEGEKKKPRQDESSYASEEQLLDGSSSDSEQ